MERELDELQRAIVALQVAALEYKDGEGMAALYSIEKCVGQITRTVQYARRRIYAERKG